MIRENVKSQELPANHGNDEIEIDDTKVKETAESAGVSDDSLKAKNKTKKADSIAKLKAEMEASKGENADLRDKNLRLLAEFDNFRKRKKFEALEAADSVKKEMMLRLLPVLDDYERLMNHRENAEEGLMDGIILIFDKFRKILEDAGIKPMDSKGKSFDPELHEAVMTVESQGKEADSVVEVIESGYFIGERVLRHAKVIVSK